MIYRLGLKYRTVNWSIGSQTDPPANDHHPVQPAKRWMSLHNLFWFATVNLVPRAQKDCSSKRNADPINCKIIYEIKRIRRSSEEVKSAAVFLIFIDLPRVNSYFGIRFCAGANERDNRSRLHCTRASILYYTAQENQTKKKIKKRTAPKTSSKRNTSAMPEWATANSLDTDNDIGIQIDVVNRYVNEQTDRTIPLKTIQNGREAHIFNIRQQAETVEEKVRWMCACLNAPSEPAPDRRDQRISLSSFWFFLLLCFSPTTHKK